MTHRSIQRREHPPVDEPAAATLARWVEYRRLSDLAPADRNPKRHDDDALRRSIEAFAFTNPLLLDERTGRLVAGHGRLNNLAALEAAAAARPDGITADTDGAWMVPVVRGWASRDDNHANAYLVADNRTTEAGGWDDRALADILTELATVDLDSVTGFSRDDLDRLIADAAGEDAAAELAEATAPGAPAPNPRRLALDVIFTVSPLHVGAFIAAEAGLKVGTQSTDSRAVKMRAAWEWKFPLTFIDNEWHNYDHAKHVEFVAQFRPKYATVRDVMTKAQCEEAGVAYYTLDQVLAMAAEMEQHAENVIVIPKFDCIADIPDRYVLGYSVPSSYGGTPLPAERFRGRRVHLLGGSWGKQRGYLSILGEDVVSIDFNYCLNQARFGDMTLPDGGHRDLHSMGLNPSNGGIAALTLSLGNIGRAVHDMYTDGAPSPVPVDDTTAAAPDDTLEPTR